MQIGENTIWAGIDETPIYKEINLDDFQKTFTQRVMRQFAVLLYQCNV
jgi:hypothetical protein